MNPYPQRSGRLVRWLLVVPVAVTAMAAILIGAPLALLALGGNPLPGGTLAAEGPLELLTSPDDGRLLWWALTVVGWVAWAAVASALLLELGAQLAGRRTPQLPGLAGPQRLAGLLVAAVLAAVTSPGVSHASAAYLDAGIHASYLDPEADRDDGERGTAPAEPTLTVHTVQRGEGLIDVAERYQVSVEQLAIANHHRPQPDGLALRPGELRVYPGWQLQIPVVEPAVAAPVPAAEPAPPAFEPMHESVAEPMVHEVASGDWMWHIAGRYLGDELRYPEIAELNPQYAAQYANYPDHIQPGDQLVLPSDAYDRGERRHATGDLMAEEPEAEAVEPPEAVDPPEAAPATSGRAAAAPATSGRAAATTSTARAGPTAGAAARGGTGPTPSATRAGTGTATAGAATRAGTAATTPTATDPPRAEPSGCGGSAATVEQRGRGTTRR